ncbi:hypothetical protein [Ramlibacter tataouinensis]|uniref:Iron dicitrate transport regulator FecR n=1 Tax=Ramlibacter tataouinensis (strain ATCC BAA-407 / DSM 14655 / LMG 21543 / TTB310) TaxID=365046 RepID=F5Y2K5_RAMTT|nr:hypothetical protein [Ramlibacter tataouinensis]AEG92368.1 conserved hypothetical protein [Ramlibacter tataouinensis TTB310]
MTHHHLQGRSACEVLWFRRRSFLGAAAAWSALGGWSAAQAQQRGNVVELAGEALVNGAALRPEGTIQTGDSVETGPGATLVFVIGSTSLLVRQNSRLKVERGATLNAVSVLRLQAGGVAGVWGGRGAGRQIVTPTLSAAIRGTGMYAEVLPGQELRSYFCNCHGTVDLAAGAERRQSRAEYHQSFWAEAQPRGGRLLLPAQPINHTDEEIEQLAGLVGQRTAWQLSGRKGLRDGSGS